MKRKTSPYESVLAVNFLLLIIYYFTNSKNLLLATIAFVLIALLVPSVAVLIDKLWNNITMGIGWVMSKVIMSVVFIVFLTPIAFFFRLFSKKDQQQDSNSNFYSRNHTYKPKDIESPW